MKLRCVLIAAAMVVSLASMPAVLAQGAGPLKVVNAADVPLWKTVALGTFANSYGLMSALDDARVAVGDLADEAMHRPAFTVTKTKSNLTVVVLSAAQLGVGDAGASRQDVVARARRLGFDLCPSEAAAQLRLQYLDQPVGEFLDIAMEPITTYGGHPVGFTLGNGGAGLMLIGYMMTEDAIVPQGRKFVFSRPLRVAQPVVP
jgi:hypothetical protein